MPYCEDEDGEVTDCELVRCDEKWGKYAGNRGATVQYDRFLQRNFDDLHLQDAARLAGNSWINLDGRFSRSKYDSVYANDVADSYTLKARHYFVAPFEGSFSFQLSSNDYAKLSSQYNDIDGSYEYLATRRRFL